MNKPKIFFAALALTLIYLSGISTSFAQESKQSEPNYEIVLHTLIASENVKDQNLIPASLANVVKKLKDTFPFAGYQLSSTYLQRIENKGSFEYKGLTDEFNEKDGMPPSFNEWSLSGMRKNSDPLIDSITFRAFRFGSRLPVATKTNLDDPSKYSQVINYQFVGFSIDNLSVSEGKPALLGTVTLPKKNQMAFIILTIREVR